MNELDEMQYDIEVQVTFLRSEEGGRRHPVFTGYRPQFFYNNRDWDAMYTFRKECVPLGEMTTAYLLFLSPEMHLGRIHVGMAYEAREGTRTIGRGVITKILNLPVSAKRADQERPKRYHMLRWPHPLKERYAHWGRITYYYECLSSGYPLQQIEMYDNGNVLLYDTVHHSDAYGTLSQFPIEFFDPEISDIDYETFYELLNRVQPLNRG